MLWKTPKTPKLQAMWLTERNIRTVVEDSSTNGLRELQEGQNRKFKELDTF